MIKLFFSTYGLPILYAAVTAVAGWLGVQIKKLYERHINTKVKADVARTVVVGVEQIYKDLHGPEKLAKALDAAAEMLAERGITVTSLELRMLIEAAVGELNAVFDYVPPASDCDLYRN